VPPERTNTDERLDNDECDRLGLLIECLSFYQELGVQNFRGLSINDLHYGGYKIDGRELQVLNGKKALKSRSFLFREFGLFDLVRHLSTPDSVSSWKACKRPCAIPLPFLDYGENAYHYSLIQRQISQVKALDIFPKRSILRFIPPQFSISVNFQHNASLPEMAMKACHPKVLKVKPPGDDLFL
jgi:hypothetical protein